MILLKPFILCWLGCQLADISIQIKAFRIYRETQTLEAYESENESLPICSNRRTISREKVSETELNN